jgi:hypothetical protein
LPASAEAVPDENTIATANRTPISVFIVFPLLSLLVLPKRNAAKP